MSEIEILPTPANDPEFNREPGILVTPGSAHQVYMARFEQLPHSKWAFGNPGNPYVFRRWPAMMYHAERYLGQIKCMEGEPQRYEFQHDQNYLQAVEGAKHFTAKCIRIVNSQEEWARAMEDGWRDGPAEAIQACKDREDGVSTQIAHRNHDDRHLSPAAQAEIKAAEAEEGNVPQPEIKRKYVRKTKKIATA